jgi:hypothetical protein
VLGNGRNPDPFFRHILGQMQRSAKNSRGAGAAVAGGWLRRHRRKLCVTACLAVLALAIGAGFLRGHAQQLFPLPAFDPPKTAPAPAGQKKLQTAATAGGPQQSQIASECADLLKMATDLKSEVDKTTKDTLSVTVVRKAGEIEELAHKVRTGSGAS